MFGVQQPFLHVFSDVAAASTHVLAVIDLSELHIVKIMVGGELGRSLVEMNIISSRKDVRAGIRKSTEF